MGARIYTAFAVLMWCLTARIVATTGFFADTLEGRLSLHSQWVSDLENKGRNLAWSPSEGPKPIGPGGPDPVGSDPKGPDPKPGGPGGSDPVGPDPKGPDPKPGGPGGPDPKPGPRPRKLIETNGTFPMAGYGYCKVLRFQSGYADLDLSYDRVIENSLNFGECCKSCQNDPNCFAWTRVAGGGGASFRNCYLMYNSEGKGSPELRHLDGGVILESGTKSDVFPASSYGCPYNAAATTPCPVPDGCNIGPDGQSTGPCL